MSNLGSIGRAFIILGTCLLLAPGPSWTCAQTASDEQSTSTPPLAATPEAGLVRMLPPRVAGISSAGGVSIHDPGDLEELVGTDAPLYREYRVVRAASRIYGPVAVDVFESKDANSAYGLFSFLSGESGSLESRRNMGSTRPAVSDPEIFLRGRYLVRARAIAESGNSGRLKLRLGNRTAESIEAGDNDVRPSLLNSLPAESRILGSERYFLGPQALARYFVIDPEVVSFEGSAEAVVAWYEQPSSVKYESSDPAAGNDVPSASAADAPVKLLVIEYHTPQFAFDAHGRLRSYMDSLADGERGRTLLKREGNFIVIAADVVDHRFAQSLIDSIEYPYTVKWLRNPLWPTNDPFRAKKAAQLLLSTFGILGLMIVVVLTGGGIFGIIVFLKRRKRQREIFSDAGGMLKLDLDPFETVILGLPPKRGDGG